MIQLRPDQAVVACRSVLGRPAIQESGSTAKPLLRVCGPMAVVISPSSLLSAPSSAVSAIFPSCPALISVPFGVGGQRLGGSDVVVG